MMRLALEQAELAAAEGEVPIGAVVYRGDEVLSQCHNLREALSDPTAHAEILALRLAAAELGTWHMEDCGIAVTIEPCPMCAGALVNARMGELVYGAADPKMGCVDSLARLCDEPRFNHRLTIRRGVLAGECVGVLQRFFQARRKLQS